MVAALLDTVMGGACWTVVTDEEDFLTADLRTEFHRSARPGSLARGRPCRAAEPTCRLLRRRAVPGRRANRECALHADCAAR
jgi:acyl-coenzyme A thioesterase PaaI-like protein